MLANAASRRCDERATGHSCQACVGMGDDTQTERHHTAGGISDTAAQACTGMSDTTLQAA
eukprot:1158490-Pelagomonas_calceolata.AAC.2